MNKKTLKILLRCFVAIIIVGLLSFPWVLYGIGLANVNGRPIHAERISITKTEAEALWHQLRETGPMEIEKLSPWDYVFLFVGKDKIHRGERLAWFVARNHNAESLKDRRMLLWHLSGASLTIWLTRNWTAQELLAKANEIKHNRRAALNDAMQRTAEKGGVR